MRSEDDDEKKKVEEQDGGDNPTIAQQILQSWHLKMSVRYFLYGVIWLFWPFFHMYRKMRYETSTNKSKRRNNYIEFERIWVMVRTVEQGIEATVQLILVLYLLVPYYDKIHNWDLETFFERTFLGVAHLLIPVIWLPVTWGKIEPVKNIELREKIEEWDSE